MKSMTCNQLGGPKTCNEKFQAETFKEITDLSKNHGMELFQKQEQDHIKAMGDMKQKMQDPEAMQNWMSEKKKEFDAISED